MTLLILIILNIILLFRLVYHAAKNSIDKRIEKMFDEI
jgi:hypothetical protein